MVLFSSLTVGLALALPCVAQFTIPPGPVPSHKPLPGDYEQPKRPKIHFSPPKGFLNDPDGLHRDQNGTWHLYYELSPNELIFGYSHWGPATSNDLYHWTNEAIAMFPHNDTTRLFTGSAVVDTNNTSGFFPDQSNGVVAIHTVDMKWPAVKQVQELSYSTDGGYSFKRWDRNPILDVGSSQFRDPKVIRHGDKWIMVVAYAADLTLGVYSSFNLKEWRHESNITHVGLLGDQYECPNLVQIPVEDTDQSAWLLQISINPGAPLGGSVIQYVPGDFNGTHFSPFDRAARLSNFGKDDYAAQFFYDEPVSIGWTSNWQYCDKTPTAEEGWRGTTTIPRRHSLVKDPIRGYEMRQVPVDLTPALGDRLLSSEQLANDKPLVRDFKNGVYLDMNVTLPQDVESPAGASFNITFTSPSNDEFKAQYFFGGPMANTTFLNRKNDAWDHPAYTDVASFSQTHTAERYQLILDRVVVEAFVDNGRGHGVMATYAKRPYDSVKIAAGSLPEGMTLTVELHDLKDTWKSASGKG